MPYKFEYEHVPMPEGKDRRIKLNDEQRQAIRDEYKAGGIGTRPLAAKYGVSRSLVIYIIHPERQERNYKLRVARGGSKQYYNKEINTAAVRNYRQHKKKVLEEDNS